ncbi:arylamine N-acetyltransferase [Cytobacillus spongiae]|uniref:arylamine N-acetyltransferase family protein n=1 Tax=Cytobacillus spongiae TaxID=2901381 RepID=UPI001F4890E2|nr:arylamine N-acetyltransferase [Cytobacillus spongiae]UII54115.1 arylamine N-acetyltransferase [Cytobacillus spongiae]
MKTYLNRFASFPITEPTIPLLTSLQQNHLLHIPFENLDVSRQVPIELNVHRFYQKVAHNQRGGFCYELNGLFHHLLEEVGYKSQLISCTVRRPDGSWAKEDSHAAILVFLDQPYLVDVGFGDSVRVPLPLTGEKRNDISGTYKISTLDSGQYDLQLAVDDHWQTKYRFTTNERRLLDFTDGCIFNQTSPHSPFTKGDMVTIATEDGRVTLSGDTLTITKGREKFKREVSSDERPSVLKDYFQIQID